MSEIENNNQEATIIDESFFKTDENKEQVEAKPEETVENKAPEVKEKKTKEKPKTKTKGKGVGKAGVAAIAGVAGFGAGVLTPLEVFPSKAKIDEDLRIEAANAEANEHGDSAEVFVDEEELEDNNDLDIAEVMPVTDDEDESIEDEDEIGEIIEENIEEETPEDEEIVTEEYIEEEEPVVSAAVNEPAEDDPDLLDVATSVDDSMSFSQAFAAARHEVGSGGMFIWHGNTYNTFYAEEWNSMSAADRSEYWHNVVHTTQHLNDEVEELTEVDPVDDEPIVDPLLDDEDNVDELEDVVDEDEIIVEPVNDEDYEPPFDEAPEDWEDPVDVGEHDFDMEEAEEEFNLENPDIDEYASSGFDPDIHIENNMDMNDFI